MTTERCSMAPPDPAGGPAPPGRPIVGPGREGSGAGSGARPPATWAGPCPPWRRAWGAGPGCRRCRWCRRRPGAGWRPGRRAGPRRRRSPTAPPRRRPAGWPRSCRQAGRRVVSVDGGAQDRLGGLDVPGRRVIVVVGGQRRLLGAVAGHGGKGPDLGRRRRGVGRRVAGPGGRQHGAATGALAVLDVAGAGEPGTLLGRARRRLHPEPRRGRGGRLVQVLLLLLDPADAGADLVQHRLQVPVDPSELLQRPVPQGLQPDGLGLDPDALALGLLPDHVGRVAGLLQHRPGVLLGLGPHLLGRLEGVLLDPRPLAPGLLEGPLGLSLDLAGPVLGRLDDLGRLLLGGVDRLLGPLGRVGQHVLRRPAGLLEDAGHMGAEMGEGRLALVFDLHAVGALLGLVGPEPLLLDLAGHLGGPHLHLAAVESPEDDHEVGHVDLWLGRLWFERAHGGDLPFWGWGPGRNPISPDDPPGRAIAYRSFHRQPNPAVSGQASTARRPNRRDGWGYRGAVANEPA